MKKSKKANNQNREKSMSNVEVIVSELKDEVAEMKEKQAEIEKTLVSITQTLKATADTVEGISKRLFVDNGQPSIQTRLNKIEGICKILVWALGVVTTISVSVGGRLIYDAVSKKPAAVPQPVYTQEVKSER